VILAQSDRRNRIGIRHATAKVVPSAVAVKSTPSDQNAMLSKEGPRSRVELSIRDRLDIDGA
jgi:hypothetical protein